MATRRNQPAKADNKAENQTQNPPAPEAINPPSPEEKAAAAAVNSEQNSSENSTQNADNTSDSVENPVENPEEDADTETIVKSGFLKVRIQDFRGSYLDARFDDDGFCSRISFKTMEALHEQFPNANIISIDQID